MKLKNEANYFAKNEGKVHRKTGHEGPERE